MNQAHVGLSGSRRSKQLGSRRLRDVDSNAHLQITVTLKGPDLPTIDASTKPLTSEEYVKAYSVDPAKVATVETVLRSYGLTIDSVTPDGRSMRVSGSMAQVQDAFPANVGIYQSAAQGEFRGREGVIQIPSQLEGIVDSVFGLDQRRVARRQRVAAQPTLAKLAPLAPTDVEQHYNFPPGGAIGQTIAIAEFGSPNGSGGIVAPAYFPDDVDAVCKKYQLSAPLINVVPVDVAPLSPQQVTVLSPRQKQAVLEESTEVMMDVEIIASLCPQATLLVLFTTFDEKGWVDLLDSVASGAHGTPASLSLSWGLAEDDPDWSAGALQAINQRLQTLALQGITACVSSGDDGSGDGIADTRAHVDFPASSPYVLSVGGTMLRSTDGGVDEVAWWQSPGYRTGNGNSGATGGGVSTIFPRPSWQTVVVPSVNPRSIDGRVVPDVAALAGPPFYDLIFDGRDQPNGGTSASAPVWAALLARLYSNLPGSSRRFVTPWLYQSDQTGKAVGSTVCRDITEGGNTSSPNPGRGYVAGQGFDAVSGWGVPDGQAIMGAM